MQQQIKLYSVLKHDTELMRKKERGDFFTEKSKEQVKAIIKSLNSVSEKDKILEKFRLKEVKENEYCRKID